MKLLRNLNRLLARERIEPYYPPRNVQIAEDTTAKCRNRQREAREYMRRNERSEA